MKYFISYINILFNKLVFILSKKRGGAVGAR